MDLIKGKKKVGSNFKWLLILFFFGIISWVFWPKSSYQTLDRNSTLTAKVKFSDMQIKVDGYGTLYSNNQKILTSQMSATVEQVLLKPGNIVEEDSVIVILSNPDIDSKLNSEEQKLYKERANLRKLKLSQERELLTEQGRINDMQSEANILSLSNQAYQRFAKDGYVSELTLKTNMLKERQLIEKIEVQKQGFERLKSIHAEIFSLQEEAIKQRLVQVQLIKEQKQGLTVRAEVAGVLQELDVKLGQSLTSGQKIALVDGKGEMVAIAKLPQSSADQIEVGQKVVVNTRRDKMNGSILRIEPAIRDGNITVEVALEEELQGVHPGMAVDIEVEVEVLENVLFVEKPVEVRSFQQKQILVVDSDTQIARFKEVSFGNENDKYIQVVSGLNVNDEIIISDMSRFAPTTQFTIK